MSKTFRESISIARATMHPIHSFVNNASLLGRLAYARGRQCGKTLTMHEMMKKVLWI